MAKTSIDAFMISLLATISTVLGCGVMPAVKDGAKAFVSRLVMQTIVDVLESQARSALLPDVVISAILGQLSVRVTYEPLLCQMVVFDVTMNIMMMKDDQFCIIVGNAVTGICTATMARKREGECQVYRMQTRRQ
ncbi:hypothetical protein KIN20_028585 [Parelaphostrongylus tenuis]|uniref:Uncharacterized protein n=1 Tax=Parelaphostrongylus tenuis TaxID=148309 RepID=A0AAD5R123_PARTN|nr:hypothetical protein KIN20_028585 [Parelaphostrongylus tenuis]